LKTNGPNAEHILAILRRHKREWVLLVVPRWLSRAQEGRADDAESRWRDVNIQLPGSAPLDWENVFTSQKITFADQRPRSSRVDQLLGDFPVALLSGEKS